MKPSNNAFNEQELKKELKVDALGVGIPTGAAEIFIDQTLKNVEKSIGRKEIITKSDLTRLIVKELKKYDKDLAYVYENRDKII